MIVYDCMYDCMYVYMYVHRHMYVHIYWWRSNDEVVLVSIYIKYKVYLYI